MMIIFVLKKLEISILGAKENPRHRRTDDNFY